jgi:hypothetical protein
MILPTWFAEAGSLGTGSAIRFADARKHDGFAVSLHYAIFCRTEWERAVTCDRDSVYFVGDQSATL